MDALCLSVIPNYWTLPFKAWLHFSFLPLWLMKSRLWLGGQCVLNTALPVIQHLLQLQSAASVALTLQCTPPPPPTPFQLSWFVFILLFCSHLCSFALLVQRGKIRSCKLHECTRVGGLELDFDTDAHNTYCWYLRDSIDSISLKLISNMFISSKHVWCVAVHDITEKLWRVSKLQGGFDWYRFAYQGKLKSPAR